MITRSRAKKSTPEISDPPPISQDTGSQQKTSGESSKARKTWTSHSVAKVPPAKKQALMVGCSNWEDWQVEATAKQKSKTRVGRAEKAQLIKSQLIPQDKLGDADQINRKSVEIALKSLKTRIEGLEEELRIAKDGQELLKGTSLEKQNQQLKENLLSVKQEVTYYKAIVHQLKEEVAGHEADLLKRDGELNSVEKARDELKNENTALQDLMEKLIAEHEGKLQNLQAGYESQLCTLKLEASSVQESLQSRLDHEKNTISEINELFDSRIKSVELKWEYDLRQEKDRRKKIEDELNRVKKTNETLMSSLRYQQEMDEELTSAIADLDPKELLKTKNDLELKTKSLEEEKGRLLAKISEQDAMLSSNASSLAKLENSLQEFTKLFEEREHQQLSTRVQSLEVKKNARHLEAELGRVLSELEQVKRSERELQNALSQTRVELREKIEASRVIQKDIQYKSALLRTERLKKRRFQREVIALKKKRKVSMKPKAASKTNPAKTKEIQETTAHECLLGGKGKDDNI